MDAFLIDPVRLAAGNVRRNIFIALPRVFGRAVSSNGTELC